MIIQMAKKHIKGCQMPTRRYKLKPQCDSIIHLPEFLMKNIQKTIKCWLECDTPLFSF